MGHVLNYVGIANQYVNDVLTGKILTCKFVKQACKRQREDLKRDFKYEFNDELANRVCRFVELLPHIKGELAGKPIKLEGWQIFILTTLFGWVDKDSYRRYKTAYTEIARKNAKSTLSSAVALYMLCMDSEGGAEVYSAATTRDQARIVFEDSQSMVRKSEGLRGFGVQVSSHTIYQESSASRMKALARDQGGNLDGLNVHCAIVDELHAHKVRDVWDVLETATGARTQPLLWAITTAGSNRSGICYEQRDYARRILEGAHEDDSYFGIIYTLDADDDWTDEANWIKANPNMGVSVGLGDMQRKARKAMELPSAQNNFLTKHLNVWVNAATSWLDMRKWDASESDLKLEDFLGEPCYLGLDLAEKRDIAALSILFKRDNTFYSFGNYYLNEQQVEHSGNSQYSGWQKSGHLIVNDGDITDFDVIADDLRDICANYDVQEIAFDPAFSSYFATKLIQEGLPMVEIRQVAKFFTSPFIELENLVYSDQFKHDGNPCMTWMVSNTMAKQSKFSGLIHPIKERPENKIDGVIALLMALGRSMAIEDSEPKAELIIL
jgi:phage terminase large subunit-like protein